ncbi:MAG TPA: alkaline phosphatase family protein, partial [Candidatus Limnocylindrales bacterium]
MRMPRRGGSRASILMVVGTLLLAACSAQVRPDPGPNLPLGTRPLGSGPLGSGPLGTVLASPPGGMGKIKHVVIIMQENRSFDTYFGTFPGANGISMANGQPSVCLPDPANGGCVRPYHDNRDRTAGGPHGEADAIADAAGGRMDGFVAQDEMARKGCQDALNPGCSG